MLPMILNPSLLWYFAKNNTSIGWSSNLRYLKSHTLLEGDLGSLLTVKKKLLVSIVYNWNSYATVFSQGALPKVLVGILDLPLITLFCENSFEVPQFTEVALKDFFRISFVTWFANSHCELYSEKVVPLV